MIYPHTDDCAIFTADISKPGNPFSYIPGGKVMLMFFFFCQKILSVEIISRIDPDLVDNACCFLSYPGIEMDVGNKGYVKTFILQ